MPEPAKLNHTGLCVADLGRSVEFYCGVFGFAETGRLEVPDEATARLLRIDPPVGLTAVYLSLSESVLELLHFGRQGNAPARDRSMTEPGLTHLSFTVFDLPGVLDRVRALGGEVLEDTDVAGLAIFVRDPDGQLLELLPGS